MSSTLEVLGKILSTSWSQTWWHMLVILNTQTVDTTIAKFQGQSQPHSKLEASQDYVRLCLSQFTLKVLIIT